MTNRFAFNHFSCMKTQFLSIKSSFYTKPMAELILVLAVPRAQGSELTAGVTQSLSCWGTKFAIAKCLFAMLIVLSSK